MIRVLNLVIKRIAILFVALGACLIQLMPFLIMLNLALKNITDKSSKWIPPAYLYLDNFLNVWNDAELGRALNNTFVITIFSVLLVVFLGALAAYPLARYQTRLNKFVYLFSISILIVPPLTILVPLYKVVVDMHGINTPWMLMALHVTFQLPLVIFLYTGFIKSIPRDLDEAAMIDGCSRFGIFFRIIMPILKPVTATAMILVGLAVWNDYQFSLFFLQKPSTQTFPVVLAQFFSQYQNNVSWVAAGSLLSMIPMTVLYIFLQKYFISGLAEGAVKG